MNPAEPSTDLLKQPCTHTGPCSPSHSPRDCGTLQFALSRKYDVNLVAHMAELSPGVFVLYNQIRREVTAIGTLEEIIAAYRARLPFVPIRREELSRRPTTRFLNVRVNL